MRSILHVDMDAFYASVEQLDAPELRGRPIIVGGSVRRGVVLAASYEARKFGARSAIPVSHALRMCPEAIVVPPRHKRYAEVSAQIFEVFLRYTPLVEKLSVDEAFLDVTASHRIFGDGRAVAQSIKKAIREEIGLTASAGVAPSKFVAKIASDLDKPDGLVVVTEDQVQGFLAQLPIERMWGVGPKTAPKLRALGYRTFGDLVLGSRDDLERHLGSWGIEVQQLAQGLDPREVIPDRAAKSIGSEETSNDDLIGKEAIARMLLSHAENVARRLTKSNLAGSVVAVKLKYSDFSLQTRRKTLPDPIADALSLYETAAGLLDGFKLTKPVRLTGVSISNLVPAATRTNLFVDAKADRRRQVEQVVFDITGRFEQGRLTRGTLIGPPKERVPKRPS